MNLENNNLNNKTKAKSTAVAASGVYLWGVSYIGSSSVSVVWGPVGDTGWVPPEGTLGWGHTVHEHDTMSPYTKDPHVWILTTIILHVVYVVTYKECC